MEDEITQKCVRPRALEPRYANMYILVHPDDCDPPHSLDMTSKHDYEKVYELMTWFELDGFDKRKAALVGYPKDGRIQLLSGTHRHLAAKRARILLPVRMVLRSVVEGTWGTDEWPETIRDIPVLELENVLVPDGTPDKFYQPVNMEEINWRDKE